MAKFLLHNLSVPYAQPLSGIYDFDQRGVFFAEAGDVLITRNRIPSEFISILTEADLNFEGIHFLFSRVAVPQRAEGILADEVLRGFRGALPHSEDSLELDTFMNTSVEGSFARSMRLKLTSNPAQFHDFHTKSSFRKVAKRYGFPIPKGFERISSFASLYMRATQLLISVPRVVCKQDSGVAGMGTFIIERTMLPHPLSLFRTWHQSDKTGINQDIPRYVVEEWIESVRSSPSVQLYVESDSCRVISVHQQLFYADSRRYRGCKSAHWIQGSERIRLTESAMAIADAYRQEGYRGHLGLNAVVDPRGDIIWTEANPRRVSSSYAFQIANRLGPGGELRPYALYNVQNRAWAGKTVGVVARSIGGRMYSASTKKGMLPVDISLLPAHGIVTFFMTDETTGGVDDLLTYAATI